MFKKLEKYIVLIVLLGMFFNFGLSVNAQSDLDNIENDTELIQNLPSTDENVSEDLDIEVVEDEPVKELEITEDKEIPQAVTEEIPPDETEAEPKDQADEEGLGAVDTSIVIPGLSGLIKFTPSSSYVDTVDATKTVVPCDGCRTYEITLDITGTPPEAKPIDVVLVIDVSQSMSSGSRLTAAKTAANTFTDIVLGGGNPNGNRVSIVSYSTNATLRRDWSNNATLVKNSINNLSVGSYTNIHDGFIKAETQIDNARPEANKVIVMMSDGGANRYMDGNTTKNGPVTYPTSHNVATIAAYQKGQSLWSKANVFTVGLFTGMPANERLIAVETLTWAAPAGQFYNAPNVNDLTDIYTSIANILNFSAKNAKIVDKIGDNFEIVPGSFAGASYNPTTRVLTWEPGTVTTSAQFKFKVAAKDEFMGGLTNTNEYATFTYTDVNDVAKNKALSVPDVEVLTKLEVKLTDASIERGQSIILGMGTDPLGDNYMAITGGDVVGTRTYEWRKVGDATVISTQEHPTVNPLVDTEYELTVVGPNGCIAIATILIKVTEPLVNITGNKVWVGGPVAKPDIQLQLYRNNEPLVGKVETLSSGTTSYTWTGLNKLDSNGDEYVYTVKEVGVPENYTKVENGLTVTNTYGSPKIDVTGNKVWVGGPENKPLILLELYQGDLKIGENIPLLVGDTSYTWTDLDKTDSNGVDYVYTVKEVGVPENYTKVEDGLIVTNTYGSPKIEVTGNKVWVNGPTDRPMVELELYQGSIKVGVTVQLLSGTTSFTWTNLDKTDANGVDYVYTVKEVGVPENYTKVEDGLTVTNTYVSPKIDVTGNKVWVNGPMDRPMVELQLYQGETKVGETVELLSGTTSFTWTNLDKTDADGVDYVYTVKEVGVPENYTKVEDGLTVTNTYVSLKIDVTGNKVWVLGPEVRPTIQLQLYRNHEMFGDPVSLENGTLQHTWTDLDATDLYGVAYVYTIMEVEVPEDYDMEISEDGLTITNIYSEVLSGEIPVIPIPSTPQTGINNNKLLLSITLILSSAGLFAITRRRKDEDYR